MLYEDNTLLCIQSKPPVECITCCTPQDHGDRPVGVPTRVLLMTCKTLCLSSKRSRRSCEEMLWLKRIAGLQTVSQEGLLACRKSGRPASDLSEELQSALGTKQELIDHKFAVTDELKQDRRCSNDSSRPVRLNLGSPHSMIDIDNKQGLESEHTFSHI